MDLTDPHDEDDLHHNSHHDDEANRYDMKRQMDDVDLCTENGTVFRIVLPNQATSERDNNVATTGGRASAERMAGAPRTTINQSPLNDALALHLPPYVPYILKRPPGPDHILFVDQPYKNPPAPIRVAALSRVVRST